MLLGTHSNAGKSVLGTAFCRIFARRGIRVAPFKAQNMSNNAGVTPEGGEMGRAQLVQADAAGIVPHTDMNPVLLKPEGGRRSQIVLNGRPHGHIEAKNWFAIKSMLWEEVQAAYDRLAARFDVILLEGAGSPAEINLKQGDIVNLRMARYANAPCLLVGDIDRGGVFAALAGTMLLLEPEERAQIHGFLINKFRGDAALLGNATEMLRERAYGVPTLGIIPYLEDLQIPDEDAVTLEDANAYTNRRNQKGIAPQVDIAVVCLPHVANFDEFDALVNEQDVAVRYVRTADELGEPHAIILPGTKTTVADLAWLRARNLDQAIGAARERGAQIVGICGGYQLLGEMLYDPDGVEATAGTQVAGLGLLPVTTTFRADKQTHLAQLRLHNGNIVEGYEIHMGETHLAAGAEPFGEIIMRNGLPVGQADGAITPDGQVWGTYLHGIFEEDCFRTYWLRTLGWCGTERPTRRLRHAEYDRLADVVEAAVGWETIEKLLRVG
jgi:adenosylcobyric acid synthase